MYLLDTNIVSALLRQPAGAVAERASRFTDDDLATSVIVIAELNFGLAKQPSVRLAQLLDGLMLRMAVLPLTIEVADHYGRARAELERRGTPIGANDLLIAAHAPTLDATLVTDNVREFARVEGLRVENWLRG